MIKQKLTLISLLSAVTAASTLLAVTPRPATASAAATAPCANTWCEPDAISCHYQAGYSCYLDQNPPNPPRCSGNITC